MYKVWCILWGSFVLKYDSEYRIKRENLFCLASPHDLSDMCLQTHSDSNDINRSPPSFQNIIFVLSFLCLSDLNFPLFWLIHLQQTPERQQVIVLLLHVKQSPSQTVRMKWGDGMISRNKLFSFCLIIWEEKTTVVRSVCLTKLLISFLSAEEVSRRGRCVWFGGQSRGEQDVQLAETWK